MDWSDAIISRAFKIAEANPTRACHHELLSLEACTARYSFAATL